MTDMACLDWARIEAELDGEGHALLPRLLEPEAAAGFAAAVSRAFAARSGDDWRSLQSLDRGRGHLWRAHRPLPEPFAAWRGDVYRHLLPIARRWNTRLAGDARYPANPQPFVPDDEPSVSCLHEGDFEALHQHAEGEAVFPLQMAILLSAPGRDFEGGEFVMTEQRPRLQSRPMVLALQQGDAAIIAVSERPFRGAQGDYRVASRHAVSRIRSGERIGLDLLFHCERRVPTGREIQMSAF